MIVKCDNRGKIWPIGQGYWNITVDHIPDILLIVQHIVSVSIGCLKFNIGVDGCSNQTDDLYTW